uniref:Uncharacterized protein n=2 Tax=Caenorhabditis japonica TaxID=281687 RepID=A0A8R1E8V2_CAEJA
MFTIRKRSLPTPPKVVGILRNYESGKKPRRSVGFLDEIGRPLVEYRNIPYDDDIDKTTSLPYHEKTSGRVDNRAKWNLVRVKTAKPLRTGPSETGLIEEMRLEENQISRAPLFGTFDVIDAPHLHIDALVRARARVPVIPLDENYIEFEPKSDNTYQQVFDVPSKPTNLVALMAQLKERGLLPTEQQSSHLPSVGIAIPQMVHDNIFNKLLICDTIETKKSIEGFVFLTA